MREALKNAVQSAILFECQLPHQESGLGKSCLSSQNDICFNNTDPQEIAKVIYNGIVEFALNEYEINYDDLEREQRRAILSRIRYNPTADNSAKLKYGFYGEVLLDLILRVFLQTSVVAARGYFYSPIENSEAKGFDAFHLLERDGNEEIKRVSTKLARTNARSLHWSGFQTILNLIFPVVREEKLKQLISFRVGDQQQYSLVTVLLSSYLEGGFMSMVDYYTTRRNPPKTKDEAIRTVADFVYNVFKYHLVKYLGLFDVFFRYRVSVLENVDMDSVPGLGLLMQKLEYNALSPTARKVSDYGVPFKLIDCYDSQAEYDKEQFDAYEKRVDEQVSRLFQ